MGTIDKAVQKSQDGNGTTSASDQKSIENKGIKEDSAAHLFEKSSLQEHIDSLVVVCRNNWLFIALFTFLVGIITGLLIGYSVFAVPAKTGDKRVAISPSSVETAASANQQQVARPASEVQPVRIERSHVCQVVSDGNLVPKKEYLDYLKAKKDFKTKAISEDALEVAEKAARPKASGEILEQTRTSELTAKELCGAWVQQKLQANYFSVK